MTYDEALSKRNEFREQRHQTLGEFLKEFDKATGNKIFEKLLNDEYSWGYWDAVVTTMKELKLKEIKA